MWLHVECMECEVGGDSGIMHSKSYAHTVPQVFRVDFFVFFGVFFSVF